MATPSLPGDYARVLADAKAAIQAARTKAVLAVNSELIGLYWKLGQMILARQETEGWGAKVVDRLSNDLRAAFPDMTGLSVRNLRYMRAFAAAWPAEPIVQQVAAQLPWGHNQLLLDRLDNHTTRKWYARAAIEHGWSRAVLDNQITSQLRDRAGAASSNFAELLPATESQRVQQMTKDPYNLEFLTLAGDAAERDLESALVTDIERFLRELGRGFAFVGRQHRLDVDGDEYFIDLLMFQADVNRYVVIELKTTKLTPADVGQLNFYVAVVDDTLRRDHHQPTVGLLLCAGRNERTVRYALSRSTSPMAVAGYRYTELPPAEQAALPGETELLEIVTHALDPARSPTTTRAQAKATPSDQTQTPPPSVNQYINTEATRG
jgi:predicted nuclease of restriction endonuclease-like (RecB) superfamily